MPHRSRKLVWRERSKQMHPLRPDSPGEGSRLKWRMRSILESMAVRRVLRGARARKGAVVGPSAVLQELGSGTPHQVLMTRRFMEEFRAESHRISLIALQGRVAVHIVTGLAALELDLTASGVGALLRASPVDVQRPVD